MTYLAFAALFVCLTILSIVLFFRKSVQRFRRVPKTLLFFGTVEGASAALTAYLFYSPPMPELYGVSLFTLTVLLLFFVLINAAVIEGTRQNPS